MTGAPSAAAAPRAGRAGGRRHVWLVFLALSVCTQLPYVKAAVAPPPGRAFVGTFHWIDDYYNYLSFVRQAEEGRFLFDSAVYLQPHRPVLVNLEWWVVGRLSAALGGRPLVAYRLFGMLATLALLLGVDRWLEGCGVPPGHRLPALVLAAVGGGLGGWLFELTELPVSRSLDLASGMFPFFEALANPHFVAGTALFVWALWLLVEASGPRGTAGGLLLGCVTSLVRPYDAVNLGAVRALGILLTSPLRRVPGRLLPLAALAPPLAYDLWIFFTHPGFTYHSEMRYYFPPRVDFLAALGPAAGLALLSTAASPAGDAVRRRRIHLACWAGLAAPIVLLSPRFFLSQHLTGVGLPLLMLGAIGLARFRPAATWLAAVALSFTSVVAVRIVLRDEPVWQVPAERLQAAEVLRSSCRHGDVFLGPPDVGLYAIGLSSCRGAVSYQWARGFAERLARAREFYGSADAAARTAWLEELCVTHLALPGDAGPVPTAWLGVGTRFVRLADLKGAHGELSLYARERPASCRTP